jgi:hypothetical protein
MASRRFSFSSRSSGKHASGDTGFPSSGKNQNVVIPSEARNLSLFFACTLIEERFLASLGMTQQRAFSAACLACGF